MNRIKQRHDEANKIKIDALNLEKEEQAILNRL
jgi:hypothetical protein